MALQAPIEYHGLRNQEGYWVLSEFHWRRQEPATVRIVVDGYASAQACAEGAEAIVRESATLDIPVHDPSQPKTQLLHQVSNILYIWLKAQVERFAEAIDV